MADRLLKSHGLPPAEHFLSDARRTVPLSPIQELLYRTGITDHRGFIGGFYGPRDLALDMIPLGVLASKLSTLRKLPFLKKIIGGIDMRPTDRLVRTKIPTREDVLANASPLKQYNQNRVRVREDFDVWPPRK